MPPISRAIVPALMAAMLVLTGCQTGPSSRNGQTAGSTASDAAPRTVQPVQIYVAQSELGPGLTGVQVPDGVVYLQSRPVLTRADLTDAAALTDRQGQHFVGLRLTEAGAQKLTAVSRQNIGNMLAVIVGRELVASPRISQALDRGVLAFTVPTADAATNLAARIRGDAAR